MLLKTMANLWASQYQANDFYTVFSYMSFWVERCNKIHMTGPIGNSGFCFPSTSMFTLALPWGWLRLLGKQNSLFPLGPVIKCSLFSLNVVTLFPQKISLGINKSLNEWSCSLVPRKPWESLKVDNVHSLKFVWSYRPFKISCQMLVKCWSNSRDET